MPLHWAYYGSCRLLAMGPCRGLLAVETKDSFVKHQDLFVNNEYPNITQILVTEVNRSGFICNIIGSL